MKKYEIGLYEKAMRNTLSWSEKLGCAKECGYDYMEMCIDATDEKINRIFMDTAEKKKIMEAVFQAGLSIGSMSVSALTNMHWVLRTKIPEWGTWLVADTNITIDLWCGNGKRTHGDGKMKVGHQMANMCGARAMQPNLRNVPFVIDPFAWRSKSSCCCWRFARWFY